MLCYNEHILKLSIVKGPCSQSYGFSSIHVWMWELDHEESWTPKNWCFWTVVLEKTLESPLDCKDSKPVSPKENQLWIFIGRTDAETPILWSPDTESQLIRKDFDAGRDWRQEEEGTTEDEMVGWHHQLNGDEFEQTAGDGEEQGSPACCSPWGCSKSDKTEWQNSKNSGSRCSESWLVCQLGTSWFNPLCHVLRLCHSFKDCAWPPSCLYNFPTRCVFLCTLFSLMKAFIILCTWFSFFE